jgi:hypothetical protein
LAASSFAHRCLVLPQLDPRGDEPLPLALHEVLQRLQQTIINIAIGDQLHIGLRIGFSVKTTRSPANTAASSRERSPDAGSSAGGAQVCHREGDDLGRGAQVMQPQVFVRAVRIGFEQCARACPVQHRRDPARRVMAGIGV